MEQVRYPKIVLFGASIIQYSFANDGLSARLADTYQRKLDVVTRGYEGYTSRWGLPLAEPVFEAIGGRFEAIIIFFGTNDASKLGTPMAVQEDEFIANMSKMTTIAQSYSDTVILVGNALINEFTTSPVVKNRDNIRSLRYNRLLKGVAEKHNAAFVDLWAEFREFTGETGIEPGQSKLSGEKGYDGPKTLEHLVHDGVHFTAEGYRLFYDAVMRELKKCGKGPENYDTLVTPVVQLVKASRSKL